MKKLLSMALVVVLILSIAFSMSVSSDAASYTTISVLIGDANESQSVDIVDATSIQRYLAKFITFSDTCKLAADSNQDKVISIIDATAIQRYLAKISFDSDIGKWVDYYTPGTDPSLYAAKKEYNGIDVSRWQGDINWEKVKASGVEFAMIRLGYGSSTGTNCAIDSYFVKNVQNATKAGVDIGCYFYSYALSVEAAKKEAEFVVDTLKDYDAVFTYPVAFDLEDNSQVKLGKTVLTNMVLEFGTTLEDAGYYCTLYSNLSWLYYYLDDSQLKRFDHWLAQWSDAPTYTGSFGMWQYGIYSNVNGISGDVDMDIAYYNYPKIIRSAKLNGFTRGAIKEPVIPTGDNGKNKADTDDVSSQDDSVADDNKKTICVEDYDGTSTMMNSIRLAILNDRCGLYLQQLELNNP